MKRIKIRLENSEPLCLRSNRADDTIMTQDYIPGNTLLGALAARYLREKPNDDAFHDHFTRDKIYFTNLYPAGQIAVDSDIVPEPYPGTAQVCKRWEFEHPVRDTLFDWGAYAESVALDKEQALLLEQQQWCPHCCTNKERMRPLSGFYQSGHEKPEINIKKGLHTHTGINRYTQTVSEGILFNYEAIEEKYCFEGIIIIKDNFPENAIQPFLNWLDKLDVHVGSRKTSGMGQSSIFVLELPELTIADFQKRLIRFDADYKNYRVKYLETAAADNSHYFSIDLLSAAIKLDDFLNYIVGFDNLPEEAGLVQTELIYERVTPVEIRGWNACVNLPRQIEIGIEKGSTALFKSRMEQEALINVLYKLENEGIGIRKAEGFGRIAVSHAFHYQNR